MAHRLGLGDLAGVFAHAHGRVVLRDLADLAAAQEIKAAVAHVADRRLVAVEHGHGEDAGHAGELGLGLGPLPDLFVGEGDRLADQPLGLGGAARQARAQHVDRGLGRDLAAGLAADAVDDREDAALGLGEDAVFVVFPLASGVGAGRGDRSGGAQGRCYLRLRSDSAK
jgi:hypothetical protein